MEAQSLADFEQSILSGGGNLSEMTKAAPLKTSEEIRAEWLQERLGKFTASEFHRLVTCPNKAELPKGAVTYCTEKAVECLTEFLDDGYISPAMQWGIDHEIEAIEKFTERTGLNIAKTGINQEFIKLGTHVGGSPDGLVGISSGVEVKCPSSLTHFKYMRIKNAEDLKAEKPEYYWQIQGLMMITASRDWWFISYDPRYKRKEHQLHYIKINIVDEDINFLCERIRLAIELKNKLLEGFVEENDKKLTHSEVMNILGIKRTKLFGLRKAGKFPAPFSDVPLLWKAGDIENYALNSGV
jgi:hypothetical protein